MIDYSPEVQEAVRAGGPVVALESARIAGGVPREEQEHAVRRVEGIVREAGATPATIACIDGAVRVGLTDDWLGRFVAAPKVEKVGTGTLPICIARGGVGATTVSATVHLAALAGISVVAAGGLGGVHRGASETFDISADLAVLARSSVVVTCAGIKSILDIPATFELLETLGITVVGLGTDVLPGFYVAETDHAVPALGSAAEVADVRRARDAMQMAGAVVAVFPPDPSVTLPREAHDSALDDALEAAHREGIHGAALTPFLLGRLRAAMGARMVDADAQIIAASATAAAEIAASLAHRVPNTSRGN